MSDWSGIPELKAYFDATLMRADRVSEEFVRDAATVVIQESQKNFGPSRPRKKNSKGQLVPVSRKRIPSPYPNVISSNLKNSITSTRLRKLGVGSASIRVGPTAIYARRVELDYGYAFFTPGVKSSVGRVQKLAVDAVTRIFKG